MFDVILIIILCVIFFILPAIFVLACMRTLLKRSRAVMTSGLENFHRMNNDGLKRVNGKS